MTLEQYTRNLRGTNENEDFPSAFLEDIYESIKNDEIVLATERCGEAAFSVQWNELLRQEAAQPSSICAATNLMDQHIFEAHWQVLLSAIGYCLTSFDDDQCFARCVSSMHLLGDIAARHHESQFYDQSIKSFSSYCGLLNVDIPASPMQSVTVRHDGGELTISPLSIQFGRSVRQQEASLVMFHLARTGAAEIRAGWTEVRLDPSQASRHVPLISFPRFWRACRICILTIYCQTQSCSLNRF